MAKIRIIPYSGSIEESKNVKIILEGLNPYKGCHILLENKTNSSNITIKDNDNDFILIDKDIIEFSADLNVSDSFKGSLVSIFVIIKDEDDVRDILPVSFFIDEGENEFYGNIFIKSSFLSISDICNIEITSYPMQKFVFLINNKKISIFTKEDGAGTFNFRMSDIVDEDITGVERYPIYFYEAKDNYTKKKFAGVYISLIPEGIKTYSDDPRCDPASEHYVEDWRNYKIPEWCYYTPPGVCETDDDCPPGFICLNGQCVPIISPPPPPDMEVERQCLEEVKYSYINMCRINSSSFSMLGNGMVFGGFSSIQKNIDINDDRYNVNGYGFDFFRTPIVNKIIASGDVSIHPNLDKDFDSHHVHFELSPSDYNFDIYVSENLYNRINNIDFEENEIKVVLFDNILNYVSFRVLEARYDEKNGSYLVTLNNENSKFVIHDWVFCVPVVFYSMDKNEDSVVEQGQSLNYLKDDDGSYIKILNIDVSSNPYYYDYDKIVSSESYDEDKEYFVVDMTLEGLVNSQSQLFYLKRIYDKNRNFDEESNFEQITFNGNNKNPKSSLDTNGNLHIVWESDRMGNNQVYYGTLGEDIILNSSSALSSSIDKNSKEKGFSLFEKNKEYVIASSEYIFGSDFEWNLFNDSTDSFIDTVENGNFFKDIVIEGNPSNHGVLAVSSMKILLEEDLNNPSYAEYLGDIYSNLNYQISFDILLELEQKSELVSHEFCDRLLFKEDIDIIYRNFVNDFEPIIDENVSNKKVYKKNDKKYVIGRIDKIYDKIIPLFGSYDFKQEDPSIDSDYKIRILKDNTTLKDFLFGLLLEKSYFKASEIGGSDSEDHIIFTGNAKLVVLMKTEDGEDFSNYFIVKEINDSFNVFKKHSLDLIVNYINIKENRYSCVLTLLDGEKEVFSQSFVSNIDYKYNYFDIAFGFPEGKSYLADKLFPYKMSMYDDIDMKITYSDIDISSPNYFLKDKIIYSPYIYDFRDYRLRNDYYENEEEYKTEDFYFAEDNNMDPAPVEEWPESDMSFSYFMKRLYNVGMESFEDFDHGKNMDGEVVNFIGAGKAVIHGNCTVSSIPGDGLFPTHGDKYLSANTNDFYIEFESPQAAFGFFGTDIGDFGGQLSIGIHYVDGSEVEYLVPHEIGSEGSTNGSVLFFGFIARNDKEQFTKVSFYNSSDTDYFGFDQMVIANIEQVIKLSPLPQIPITFKGINKCPKIESGYCNDSNIVWQGNRNKYWNIYITNSLDKLKYFRYDTMVTNTKSNSLMPDISSDRNGNRMIVWHDNRDKNFSIYSARSISNYGCNLDSCKKEKIDIYKDRIVECYIEFEFEAEHDGYYNFILTFFSDQNLENVEYEIESQDSIDEFYINGSSLGLVGAYEGEDFLGLDMNSGDKVIITYIPINRKDIYDKILYVTLKGITKE